MPFPGPSAQLLLSPRDSAERAPALRPHPVLPSAWHVSLPRRSLCDDVLRICTLLTALSSLHPQHLMHTSRSGSFIQHRRAVCIGYCPRSRSQQHRESPRPCWGHWQCRAGMPVGGALQVPWAGSRSAVGQLTLRKGRGRRADTGEGGPGQSSRCKGPAAGLGLRSRTGTESVVAAE